MKTTQWPNQPPQVLQRPLSMAVSSLHQERKYDRWRRHPKHRNNSNRATSCSSFTYNKGLNRVSRLHKFPWVWLCFMITNFVCLLGRRTVCQVFCLCKASLVLLSLFLLHLQVYMKLRWAPLARRSEDVIHSSTCMTMTKGWPAITTPLSCQNWL